MAMTLPVYARIVFITSSHIFRLSLPEKGLMQPEQKIRSVEGLPPGFKTLARFPGLSTDEVELLRAPSHPICTGCRTGNPLSYAHRISGSLGRGMRNKGSAPRRLETRTLKLETRRKLPVQMERDGTNPTCTPHPPKAASICGSTHPFIRVPLRKFVVTRTFSVSLF